MGTRLKMAHDFVSCWMCFDAQDIHENKKFRKVGHLDLKSSPGMIYFQTCYFLWRLKSLVMT